MTAQVCNVNNGGAADRDVLGKILGLYNVALCVSGGNSRITAHYYRRRSKVRTASLACLKEIIHEILSRRQFSRAQAVLAVIP